MLQEARFVRHFAKNLTWSWHQLAELAEKCFIAAGLVWVFAQAFAGSLIVRPPGLLQEARFDRHFVRDLTWSWHQLEELAERRFVVMI